jgi:hypothetical protein
MLKCLFKKVKYNSEWSNGISGKIISGSKRIRISIIVLFLAEVLFNSCQKGFLDAKPDINLSTITTLTDCELLLNNEDLFNRNSDPSLGQLSTDEYYVTSEAWNASRNPTERNAYIFSKSIYPVGASVNDWDFTYKQIYTANSVLDALNNIKASDNEKDRYNQIKGTALFYRAWAYYNLVQLFAMPFDSSTASATLGVPLRLSSDLNIKSYRSSVAECYRQIIKDVEESSKLLPNNVSFLTKPSAVAANALLARIYLAIGNFYKALAYANSVLAYKKDLINFNELDTTLDRTLTSMNTPYPIIEEIYHSTLNAYSLDGFRSMIVDSVLYNLYDDDDIRKSAFFKQYNGYIRFKGSYDFKTAIRFSGLATDEIYLIRAESFARLNKKDSAMNDLNQLLYNRYRSGTFIPRTAVSPADALDQTLLERRKELCFRGLRWTDLRRLNKETLFAKKVTHIIDGVVYELLPNDIRYAFPIPDPEIEIGQIQQNNR